jgi:hypothetical protein
VLWLCSRGRYHPCIHEIDNGISHEFLICSWPWLDLCGCAVCALIAGLTFALYGSLSLSLPCSCWSIFLEKWARWKIDNGISHEFWICSWPWLALCGSAVCALIAGLTFALYGSLSLSLPCACYSIFLEKWARWKKRTRSKLCIRDGRILPWGSRNIPTKGLEQLRPRSATCGVREIGYLVHFRIGLGGCLQKLEGPKEIFVMKTLQYICSMGVR